MNAALAVIPLVDLMSREIPPESANEFREWLLDLIDNDECHPLCIFADPERDTVCTCPCEGLHHGVMREVRA